MYFSITWKIKGPLYFYIFIFFSIIIVSLICFYGFGRGKGPGQAKHIRRLGFPSGYGCATCGLAFKHQKAPKLDPQSLLCKRLQRSFSLSSSPTWETCYSFPAEVSHLCLPIAVTWRSCPWEQPAVSGQRHCQGVLASIQTDSASL